MKQLSVIFLFALSLSSMAATVIELKSNATVTSPVIRLKDVAHVTGENASLLDTLSIAHSAVPGCTRLVLRDELLLFSSVPEEVRKSVLIRGVQRCSVKSVGIEVRLSDIEETVKEEIGKSLIWKKSDYAITFRKSSDEVLAELWSSNYSIELSKLRRNDLKGNAMFTLYLTEDKRRERISLQGEITVNTKVLVATRKLHPGEKLTAGDYAWQKTDITHLPYRPVTQLESSCDYTVKSGVISDGQIITSNRIKKSKTIENGSPVTIIAKAGKVSVAIQGRARGAGDIGDVIAVENSVSRKIIRGIVVKPGVVQVYRGGNV